MAAVRQTAHGRVVVLGMVDPASVLHLGTPSEVAARSREALAGLAPGGGFILGPGCALVPETPAANVGALVAAAATHGQHGPDGALCPSGPAAADAPIR
jgi:uroporphyrinogen decarboxylase